MLRVYQMFMKLLTKEGSSKNQEVKFVKLHLPNIVQQTGAYKSGRKGWIKIWESDFWAALFKFRVARRGAAYRLEIQNTWKFKVSWLKFVWVCNWAKTEYVCIQKNI